ncbi:2'-5' RNA ligase family protein [Pseudoxanthomonas sp. J35]|uniref:2'-5' RNA ligase family protein n=1 Tax=Pseudoxanthomonas sp. J35 TaxID=935852 RepID=UPI0004B2C7C8|nr:2'-5' RNA ligase family protein [Pseudoxanthomonas sp. J35]
MAEDLFGTPAGHHSLFLALLPDAATVQALRAAQRALEAGLPPQRGPGVPDERLHLTLHWLGEWPQLPELTVDAARAAAASVRQAPFVARLDMADCFGRGEAVWVLRCAAPPPDLHALYDRLATALVRQRIRLPSTSPFVPHATLRRRASIRFPARAIPPVGWPAADFALVHSQRDAAGTVYRVLGRWPLRAA